MYFLNLPMLLGAAAIAIPIAIHLINRHRVRRTEWAAMRFLRASIEKHQRRLRLEDILLLLLRCLLLILLAIALARPALRRSPGSLANFGLTPATTVILLDNSYSMAATDAVQTRFDKARKAAEESLDSLPSGSEVAVWLVSDIVRNIIPEPTRDLNLARKIIRDAPLSDHATNLLPALQQGTKILTGRHAARKEIHLITDGQAPAWQHWPDALHILDATAKTARLRVILTGNTEGNNLALTDLRLAGSLAPLHQPLRFDIRVTNFSHNDARDLRLALNVDTDPPSDEGIIDFLPAGTSRSLSLFAKLRTDGFHSITARINEDSLPSDDCRSIVVRALKSVRVLLVDDTPGREDHDKPSFFLRQALTPVSATELSDYFIKPFVITPAELTPERLDNTDAVILAGLFDLTNETMSALDQFISRGGGVIVFPGERCDRAFYNDRCPFLPGTIGEPRGEVDKQETFASLQPAGYQHSIVSLWNDPAAGSLATARFFRFYPLEPKTNAAVIVRYNDGTPAILERTQNLGRVVLFSSTGNTAWNDLPVRPSFVPLLHRALGAVLARQDESLNIRVGDTFHQRLPSEYLGKDVVITPPASDKSKHEFRRVESVHNEPWIQAADTDHAGTYEVAIAGDPPLALKFAAQADASESDLTPLTPAQLAQLSERAQVFQYPSPLDLRTKINQEVIGSEIWWPVALLALLVGAVETWLAQKFSRSK